MLPEATHDVRVTGPIDPEAPEPLYEQLAGLLREDIRAGRIPPRRALPSNRALTQEHGVARGTATKAVQVLIAEGWAFAVTGRGVFAVAEKDRPALPGSQVFLPYCPVSREPRLTGPAQPRDDLLGRGHDGNDVAVHARPRRGTLAGWAGKDRALRDPGPEPELLHPPLVPALPGQGDRLRDAREEVPHALEDAEGGQQEQEEPVGQLRTAITTRRPPRSLPARCPGTPATASAPRQRASRAA